MTWSNTLYLCHPDEATARAEAAALGIDFPADGSIPTGNENYALVSPMESPWQTPPVYGPGGLVTVPGVRMTGYWSMLRLNTNWAGYAQTMAALPARLRTLASPPNIFA